MTDAGIVSQRHIYSPHTGLNLGGNLIKALRHFGQILKEQEAKLSLAQELMLVNVFALFMPFDFCVGTVLLTAIYFCFFKPMRERVFLVRHFIWLPLFTVLVLVTELCYGNFIGIAPTAGIFFYILFGLFMQNEMDENLQRKTLLLLIFGSVFCGVVAAAQVLLKLDLRINSTFENPNYYANICEFMLIVCVYVFFQIPRARWLAILGFAANLFGLFITGCRSAWPAALTGLLILLLGLHKKKLFTLLLGATLLAGAAMLFVPKLIPRLGDFWRQFDERRSIWGTAWASFLKRPLFGEGAYTYMRVSTGFVHKPHAHNLFLDTIVNYGIVGTAAISGYLVPHFIGILRNFRRRPIDALKLGIILATFVHGMTDVTSIAMQTGLLFVILCSLGLPTEELYRGERYTETFKRLLIKKA